MPERWKYRAPIKSQNKKVPTPHAADDMPLWDGHFLIVGKCSEGKVRNVKKYFIHAPAWTGGAILSCSRRHRKYSGLPECR